MDTLETLLSHRTIRNYLSKPIEGGILEEILEAGSRASTTGNMQVYSIIITKNEEKKKKLWELHFRQGMILQAPVLLTFCCDFRRFNIWCINRGAVPGYDNFLSFFTGAIDALLAAQNVCVAAEAKGLGICYLGTTTYMADKLVDFFNLPEGVVPITTLVVGYPNEDPGLTDRLPMKGILHYEEYQDYSPEMIDTIYQEKENLPTTKQLLTENNLATLAQIFTEKRYTRKDNVHFSKVFLDIINSQGFMNHSS